MTNRYKSGDWYAICDVCAFKYHASQLKQRWDGLMVCPKDYEIRQPQDFARVVRDNPTPPWQRPQPPDVFLSALYENLFDTSNLQPVWVTNTLALTYVNGAGVTVTPGVLSTVTGNLFSLDLGLPVWDTGNDTYVDGAGVVVNPTDLITTFGSRNGPTSKRGYPSIGTMYFDETLMIPTWRSNQSASGWASMGGGEV